MRRAENMLETLYLNRHIVFFSLLLQSFAMMLSSTTLCWSLSCDFRNEVRLAMLSEKLISFLHSESVVITESRDRASSLVTVFWLLQSDSTVCIHCKNCLISFLVVGI